MKKFLFLITALTILGCNSPGCLIEDKAADFGANFVASVLECEHVDAIKADALVVLDKTGICKQAEAGVQQGVLADTFCPVLADGFVDLLASGIPPKYGCKATSASAYSKAKLIVACKKLPV